MTNKMRNKWAEQVTELKKWFECVSFIFLVLKLAEDGPVSQWDWWWVLSPIWIGACVVIPLGLWARWPERPGEK